MAPDTEAPSEMLIYFPKFKALCAAEDATHTFHNLLTLRGAVVRDPHGWARYLTETIDLFGRRSEVVFASHHWPTWGSDRVIDFLTSQRDLYAYVHDQTLRMLNRGLVGSEIAEQFVLPPALERAWNARGYYGSISHNVKAIYQRYMGWFDGNPAHLWNIPLWRGLEDTSVLRAELTRSSPKPVRPLTAVISAGPPRSSTMRSSLSPRTRQRELCSPTLMSRWDTGLRMVPGETSSSPGRRNCALATWAHQPLHRQM